MLSGRFGVRVFSRPTRRSLSWRSRFGRWPSSHDAPVPRRSGLSDCRRRPCSLPSWSAFGPQPGAFAGSGAPCRPPRLLVGWGLRHLVTSPVRGRRSTGSIGSRGTMLSQVSNAPDEQWCTAPDVGAAGRPRFLHSYGASRRQPGRDTKLVARFEPPGNRVSNHSGSCRSEAGLFPWSEPRTKSAKSQGLERTSRLERDFGDHYSNALSRVAAPA